MKKIYSIIIAFLPVSFLISGCEKRLEIVPATLSPQDIILSNMDGIDGGLNFAYQALFQEIGRNTLVWPEILADHLLLRGSLYPTHQFLYNRDLSAVAAEPVSSTNAAPMTDIRLRGYYNPINTVNLVMEACNTDLPKNDLTYAANKNRVLGECYFLRAIAHFEMSRLWAKPWGATNDNSHPGIVLMEHSSIDRESLVKPRATLAQVYASVIRDLETAAGLLPEAYEPGVHSAVYNGRTFKPAALAYLTKVYFQQGNYPKAKETINRIIGATPGVLSSHPLNPSLTALFSVRGPDNSDPEVLSQVTASLVSSAISFNFNQSNQVDAIYILSSAAPRGVVTNQFLADAKYAASDIRRTTLFRTLSDGRVTPIKYALVNHFNIPLARTAEMLLDRAEIFAMDNEIENAVKDVNLIRQRAQITLLTSSITQAALIDSIRTERIRELAFEGDRLHNLRRLKLPIPPGERTGAAPLPWNGLDLILKFSAEDMARNTLLENNY